MSGKYQAKFSDIILPHRTAPAAPVNGEVWTTTAGMYARINGSTVGPLGTGGGSGSVATDSIWVAAGDTVYGTGTSAASILSKGTAYQIKMMNSGATAPVWSSTLGATGTRLAKGWFTDFEVTNLPTINGGTLATALGLTALGTTSPGTGVTTAASNAVNGSGGFLTYGNSPCNPTEIDAHTAQSPTAAQLAACNATSVHNYNQAASNINNTLPTAAANLGFIAMVSTAQAANYWRFTAASAGTIYLNGSATGKDYVEYTTPAAGAYFSCFTANRGNTYVWYCADGIGSLATN